MSPYLVTDPTFRLYELSGLIQELTKSNNPLSNLFCGEGWTKRSFFGPGSPTIKRGQDLQTSCWRVWLPENSQDYFAVELAESAYTCII